MLKVGCDYMGHLRHAMANYSFPSPIYSILLKKELISLHARALATWAPCYNNIVDQFLELYKCLDELGKNLIYEIYQHDLVVTWYNEWDTNPYVGNVHIRSFASFMNNQLKWRKAMGFVEKFEKTEGMRLRG